MPGKKKCEKESKAAQRRVRKEKRSEMGEDADDYVQLNNQLLSLGLVLKQIPGDGNCLFRALGDQISGSPHDHFKHREEVVRYMLDHRDDFEPFVEDDISFDEHLRNLSEVGTFAGNDSIVAFAKLHNITVVIHQLNKPLWQIHGGVGGSPGLKEGHISYHNGDHYNSVRRSGDVNSTGPAGIRLSSLVGKQTASTNRFQAQSPHTRNQSDESAEESDYENYPSSRKLDNLVEEVSRLTGLTDEPEIINALEQNAFRIQGAVDQLVDLRRKRNKNSLWSDGGTGTRILGSPVADAEYNRYRSSRNKNMSAARQKEMKKRQQRLEKVRTKGGREAESQAEAVISGIKTLTI